MSALPADVEAFTGMMAQLLKEAGLAQDIDADDPERLEAIPQDYLMDSLVVMRRVGLDPAELRRLGRGRPQAPGAGSAGASVPVVRDGAGRTDGAASPHHELISARRRSLP
jgi:hypothetical protein